MKKLYLMPLIMLAQTSIADDFYTTVNFGLLKPNLKLQYQTLDSSGNVTSSQSKQLKSGIFTGSVALGTYLTPNVRTEAELSYSFKTFKLDQYSKLKEGIVSGFGNLYYDFGSSNFIPYIMGGIGMTHMNHKFKVKSPLLTDILKKTKNSLTLQTGLGVDMVIREDMKLGVGYRYRYTSSSKVNASDNMIGIKYKLKSSHFGFIGVRYEL